MIIKLCKKCMGTGFRAYVYGRVKYKICSKCRGNGGRMAAQEAKG